MLRRLVFMAPLSVPSLYASAAEFCVTTVPQLQSTMDTIAHSQGESHHVKIATGDYSVDYVGFYSPGALTIEGGYDASCTVQTQGALGTVLRSMTMTQEASMHAFGGNLIVTDLALEGYFEVFIFPQGAGYTLDVERVAIALGGAQTQVEIHTSDGNSASLSDVLVDTNSAMCGLQLFAADLDFVTVVNRGSGPAVCNPGGLMAVNSIFQSAGSVDVQAGGSFLAIASIFSNVDGILDPASTANLVGPVAFEAADSSFLRDRPADIGNQIARDSAIAVPIAKDILGGERTVGSAPDRGAFELAPYCDVILKDGFDQTQCSTQGRGHSHHTSACCIP